MEYFLIKLQAAGDFTKTLLHWGCFPIFKTTATFYQGYFRIKTDINIQLLQLK